VREREREREREGGRERERLPLQSHSVYVYREKEREREGEIEREKETPWTHTFSLCLQTEIARDYPFFYPVALLLHVCERETLSTDSFKIRIQTYSEREAHTTSTELLSCCMCV